jgi:hypothetical protein
MVTARERWLGRTDVNPLYVVVGAGDFVVEKARDASTMITQGKINIPVGVRPLRYRVSNTVAQVQSTIGETVDAMTGNPGAFVRSQYGRALDAYEDLGIRGHKVVAKTRGKAEDAAGDARRLKEGAKNDARRLKDEAVDDARELKDDAKGKARELGDEAKKDVRRNASRARASAGSGTSRSAGTSGTRAKSPRTNTRSGSTPSR